MQNVLYIVRPRESASVFFKNAKIFKKDANGEFQDTGTVFGKATAPKASQVFKPRWTSHINQFPFDLDNKELNDFIKSLMVQYPSGHSRDGDIIDRANIRDSNDPFFNSIELKLVEGMATLDPNNKMDALVLRWLLNKYEPRFAEYRPGDNRYPKEVRYLVMQVGQEMKDSEIETNDEIKFYELLGKKSQNELYVIAIAMGLNVSEENTKDQLKAVINTKYKNSQKLGREFDGKNFIQYANELLTTKAEDLQLKYVITRALKSGRGKSIVKSAKTNTYWVNDFDTKARTQNDLEAFLKKGENVDVLNHLRSLYEK